ncbi:integrase [Kushneria sinocarnis]|uniref:Integrase n=1 Tax=Kushneria sinocarnis TaxID=595502 RepID=A0A420WVJ4_9GAMM|nr:tyrosine-type recombinase/integrase [Kushneria sinocarnis]RKR02576.1 integrase [Kushneria sinocarnis]
MKRSEIKRRPLADTTISKLEPEARQYREHDGNGLYLCVTPKGSKLWHYRFKRRDGKWSWKGLGSYPAVSAKTARARVHDIQHGREDIHGPDKPVYTFRQAAEDWYQHKVTAGIAPSSTRQMRIYLDKDILPLLGDMHIEDVARGDCARVQTRVESRNARRTAEKVRGWMTQIFSRAIAQGHCELNPASELRQIALPTQPQRFPHLLEPELPEFLRALRNTNSHMIATIATWMLLRTASRPGMVRNAEWSEIDFDESLWVVPAHKMKMRREHHVPLATQVMADLRRLHERTGRSQYLFPGQRDSAVMSDATINKVIHRIGFKGKLVGHGSRHTASTLLHEHGWPSDHIEAQLSHGQKGVAGIYNRATYLKQRREMMQWYADYLDQLERQK